jgi:hypothetical protein
VCHADIQQDVGNQAGTYMVTSRRKYLADDIVYFIGFNYRRFNL